MFCKTTLLSFVTLALGATSVMGASIPRVKPEFKTVTRRTDTNGAISMAYFVNWGIYARNFQPADIPVDKLSHVLYSFMDVDASTGEIKLSDQYADTDKHYPDDSWDGQGNNVFGCIKQMYALKLKNRHLKVVFSVGGWTYSQAKHFAFVTSDSARATFVQSAIKMIEDFGFDGVDIDFEFPEPAEKEAFGKLIVELRTALDDYAAKKGDKIPYIVSAAVSAGPAHYINYDIKAMDAPISFWNLMSYDYAGSWSNFSADQANVYYGETTGFNSDQAITYFLGEGATASKITFGMPIYGRSFEKTDGIYMPYDGIGAADQSNGSWEGGVWDYKSLPLAGATETTNKTSIASYSYDAAKKQLISYDNKEVIQMKTKYLMDKKLGGSMWWELSSDKKGDDSLIATAAGIMGALDTSDNHINYPNSAYENIKNQLGGGAAPGGAAPPAGGGQAPSSSAPAPPASSAPAPPASSAPAPPASSAPAPPASSAPAPPATSAPAPPPATSAPAPPATSAPAPPPASSAPPAPTPSQCRAARRA